MSPRSLERSGHITFIDENVLYVWGGYQGEDGEDVVLPGDEIWLLDLYSGTWQQRELTGDVPSDLTGFCGSFLNGTLYIFAGCDSSGYTNHMFTVDLRSECYVWIRITNTSGKTPSPRKNHSSWVHQDRIIYFGGYGCKTMREVQNGDSSNFTVEDMSWTTIEGTLYRCWGWNNEVYIFDTLTSTWILPQTKGLAPVPRSCHAAAILENKGYISGGVQTAQLQLYCLDLLTWTWTRLVNSGCSVPMGRTMHSMIATLDGTLFVYGGSGTYTSVLNDAWQYNLYTKEWTQMDHQHKDKPRVSHTSCLGNDSDIIVFGGCRSSILKTDPNTSLRSTKLKLCNRFLSVRLSFFSFRLCEDCIKRNYAVFEKHLNCLPSKIQNKLEKICAFFSEQTLKLLLSNE
ncbi:hypothetical protein NQD34_014414 [Periophthalmus magnuspinnatus]|nr:hypothetical protein NQD34_014414 [Periophthalmus magnuspinnatus]